MQQPLTAAQALGRTRLLWAMLIVSQLTFAGITLVLIKTGQFTPAANLHPLLFYLGVGLLLIVLLIGSLARSQIYKAHWRGHAITPRGYLVGNLVKLTLLTIAALFALMAALITGVILPNLLVTGAALGVQFGNFPNGRAMQPTPPPFVTTRTD